MEGFELLVAVLTVLAAVLFFISIIAYKRNRTWGLLFATMVFALFFVKGIVLSLSIFTSNFESLPENPVFHLVFDVVILLFLFFAVLSPPESRKGSDLDSKEIREGKT